MRSTYRPRRHRRSTGLAMADRGRENRRCRPGRRGHCIGSVIDSITRRHTEPSGAAPLRPQPDLRPQPERVPVSPPGHRLRSSYRLPRNAAGTPSPDPHNNGGRPRWRPSAHPPSVPGRVGDGRPRRYIGMTPPPTRSTSYPELRPIAISGHMRQVSSAPSLGRHTDSIHERPGRTTGKPRRRPAGGASRANIGFAP